MAYLQPRAVCPYGDCTVPFNHYHSFAVANKKFVRPAKPCECSGEWRIHYVGNAVRSACYYPLPT